MRIALLLCMLAMLLVPAAMLAVKHAKLHRKANKNRHMHTALHIAVMTSWNDYSSRQRIRSSWLSFSGNYSYSFIVGQRSPSEQFQSDSLPQALMNEMKRHNDIKIGNFVDSYYNLTRKAVEMLNLYEKADYLFKADTDTYVNVPQLLRVINKKRTTGSRLQYAGRVVKKLYPDRDSKARWYMPHSAWPTDAAFPPFVQGQGYLIESSLAQCMVDVVARDWPQERLDFPLEDVFVGLLARSCDASPQHLVTLAQYVKTADDAAALESRQRKKGDPLMTKSANTTADSSSAGGNAWLPAAPGEIYTRWVFAHRLTEAQILAKLLERTRP